MTSASVQPQCPDMTSITTAGTQGTDVLAGDFVKGKTEKATHTLEGVIDITSVFPDWREVATRPGLNLHEGGTYDLEDFFRCLEGVDDEYATLAQRIADKLPYDGVSYITIR